MSSLRRFLRGGSKGEAHVRRASVQGRVWRGRASPGFSPALCSCPENVRAGQVQTSTVGTPDAHSGSSCLRQCKRHRVVIKTKRKKNQEWLCVCPCTPPPRTDSPRMLTWADPTRAPGRLWRQGYGDCPTARSPPVSGAPPPKLGAQPELRSHCRWWRLARPRSEIRGQPASESSCNELASGWRRPRHQSSTWGQRCSHRDWSSFRATAGGEATAVLSGARHRRASARPRPPPPTHRGCPGPGS